VVCRFCRAEFEPAEISAQLAALQRAQARSVQAILRGVVCPAAISRPGGCIVIRDAARVESTGHAGW
jgi:hypothetical protein